MIIGIGVDIIEIARIEESFARRGNRFRDRVFTGGEIEYCESQAAKYASYAARFAAKEALMKALATGWGSGVGWRQVEVVRGEKGAPVLKLTGRAMEVFNELGAKTAHLSMAHSRDSAIAHVLLES